MTLFQACDPAVEVAGEAVLAVVEGMGRFQSFALELLDAHGIRRPVAGGWYPQQAWLDVFREVADRLGPANLRTIGRRIPHTAIWPEGVRGVHEALASIDAAYHLNHRGGEIGSYAYRIEGDRCGRMVCRNPYPCAFDQGIILGVAQRFAALDAALAEAPHRPPRACRDLGEEACTFFLEW